MVLLEEKDKVSHYDWRGDNQILCTCYRENKEQYYALYRVDDGNKLILDETIMKNDGHPSFLSTNNQFITDTYPLEHCLQYLYSFDMRNNKRKDILKIYSSPLMTGEKRCDLHPRISCNEEIISIDSTFSGNRRKIVCLFKEQEK